MTAGELVLVSCLAGIAGSLATMVILGKREWQDRQAARRVVPPVTDKTIQDAKVANALERAGMYRDAGVVVDAEGRMLHEHPTIQ